MKVLGIEMNNLTREEIIQRVKFFLDEPRFHQIATVNPEFLLEAERNSEFRTVLQNCDLRIADGVGITLAMLCKGEKLKCRFPGADLVDEIIHQTSGRGKSVYLAIRKDGLSSFQEVKDMLLKIFPELQIDGDNFDPQSYQLPVTSYQVIFCNFGAPAQELFLASLKDNPNIRLAIGVGGSFDYLTGKLKRAPKFLRSFGLEWLWRLIQQPKRWKRIWNAVIVFPIKVLIKI
jgi:N-acetylglucosaminyldiphosphoundecaprenol N-acetyl-beta-D-mannosaminyltransferase